jgi:serine/threonine protein kinase
MPEPAAEKQKPLPPVPKTILKKNSSTLSGNQKLNLGFQNLNTDFRLPEDFQLMKKLGKGAYGKVMHIMHRPTMREYACKRFEFVFDDKQRARRLLREISILSKLVHPCTNRLLCILPPAQVAGTPEKTAEEVNFNEVYLLLRKCDMDLKKLLKSSKHLEETQVKSIVYDILCGLKYLHACKVIHRDLKPGNILVNDDCTIQICDFGLARSMKGVVKPPTEDSSPNTDECPSPGVKALALSLPGMLVKKTSSKISPMIKREQFECPEKNARKEAIDATRPQLSQVVKQEKSLLTISENAIEHSESSVSLAMTSPLMS